MLEPCCYQSLSGESRFGICATPEQFLHRDGPIEAHVLRYQDSTQTAASVLRLDAVPVVLKVW
jgi:hypothetical protein